MRCSVLSFTFDFYYFCFCLLFTVVVFFHSKRFDGAMAEGTSSNLSLENVLALLDQVKTTFAKQPEKFLAFKNTWSKYLRNE